MLLVHWVFSLWAWCSIVMFLNLFLVNLSILAVTLIPLLAILIGQTRINGRKPFIIIQELLALTTTLAFLFPPVQLRISYFFWFYSLFLMLYMGILTLKFGYQNVHGSLAIGLLMVFIAANYWEIPVYVYATLGLSDYSIMVALPYHVHHVYVLGCFWIMQRMSGFKFNKVNVSSLVFGVILLFVLLSPMDSPLIFRFMLARLCGLTIFGYSILSGITIKSFKPLL